MASKFSASDYLHLPHDKRQAVDCVHDLLNGDGIDLHAEACVFDGKFKIDRVEADEDPFPEYFDLLVDPEGCCVPEGYTEDGDIRGSIMRKFRVVIQAGMYMARQIICPKNDASLPWWETVINPSIDDSTRVVIHDGRHVLYTYDSKPWNFHFETLEELADFVLDVRRQVFNRYYALHTGASLEPYRLDPHETPLPT